MNTSQTIPTDPAEVVRFFDELPLWSAPFGIRLLDAIQYKANLTALDIGFGTGFPLIELAMRLGDTCVVHGIDPWKEAIIRAQQKIDYHQVSNVRIIEGVAESIPLGDRSVDLIVSNNGINNVSDLDKVLSECARVAKEDAQFVLTMNLNTSMLEFYNALEQVLKERSLTSAIQLMHDHIYHKRRPLDEIHAKLEDSGFQVTHVAEDKFHYRFTDASTMFRHAFIQLAFMPSWKAIVPVEQVDSIFASVETRLNEKARNSNGMTLTIPFVVIDARRR